MDTFTVTPYLNTTRGASFDGYQPTNTVGRPFEDMTLRIAAANATHAACDAYPVGNHQALDAAGRAWPTDVRSLSVGDVLRITDPAGTTTWWAIARYGVITLDGAPQNIGELVDTYATSRTSYLVAL